MARRSGTHHRAPRPLAKNKRQSSFTSKLNPSAYDPENFPPTCRSALPHKPAAIRDHVKHYFACIDIAERVKFFDLDHEIWKYEYEVELKNARTSVGIIADDEAAKEEAKGRVLATLTSVAVAIEAQYRRTQILRKALRAPRGETTAPAVEGAQPEHKAPAGTKDLVRDVEDSGGKWRSSVQYREGIEEVKRWKQACARPAAIEDSGSASDSHATESNGMPPPNSMEPGRVRARQIIANTGRPLADDHDEADYVLERDINAYLIQYTRKEEERRQSPDFMPSLPSSRTSTLQTLEQTNQTPTEGKTSTSQKLQERRLRPIDESLGDCRFKGRFPGQRLSIESLLGDPATGFQSGLNVLSKDRSQKVDNTRIRYFHIPSNNMEWVERAIAAYYNEKRPNLGSHSPDPYGRTQTQMLLRPQFWRGQQHASRSGTVHARHMRPLCERVSSAVDEIEDNPKNIVLFMPYLHWETDRMRITAAKTIERESLLQSEKRQARTDQNRADRKAQRRELSLGTTPITHPQHAPSGKLRRFNPKPKGSGTTGDFFAQFVGVDPNSDPNARLLVKNLLGQYLLDAARLHQAMSTYRDQQMLEKYLFKDPPLHPRRTLDQSYYWTLNTTRERDRDQVVYRGTSMNLETSHRLLEPPHLKEKNGPGVKKLVSEVCRHQNSGKEPKWQWTGHHQMTDEKGCIHCRNDIRRISQLVMVDQLWMWVLDEQTIITSFPRRYGFNKHDFSGVHRSIRERLQSARKNQIRSVYDLALIILDECSNTFFDRIKTKDSQPQVMDIFSEAIGKVTNKHTLYFQRVWDWASEASAVYRSKSKHTNSSTLHGRILDIYPEGKLQQEIKDIIDELDIMLHIYNKQREVIRRFCKHVEHIFDPDGRWKEGSTTHAVTGDQAKTLNDKEVADEQRRKQLSWFRSQSQELLADVDDRIGELEGLRKAAGSTAQSVTELLSLKQQQASVVQAWESVKQAEEAVRQGRTIMVFTIFTIIFLPLSFMSSVFGMNNVEFGDNTTQTLLGQFTLMFPISLGVIIFSLCIAFSSLIRAIIHSATHLAVYWLLVNTGIYRVWLRVSETLEAQKLLRATEKRVDEMKQKVRQAKLDAHRARAAKKEERDKEEDECRGEQVNEGAEGSDENVGSQQGAGSEQEKKVKRRKNATVTFMRTPGGRGARISRLFSSDAGSTRTEESNSARSCESGVLRPGDQNV